MTGARCICRPTANVIISWMLSPLYPRALWGNRPWFEWPTVMPLPPVSRLQEVASLQSHVWPRWLDSIPAFVCVWSCSQDQDRIPLLLLVNDSFDEKDKDILKKERQRAESVRLWLQLINLGSLQLLRKLIFFPPAPPFWFVFLEHLIKVKEGDTSVKFTWNQLHRGLLPCCL